MKNYLNWPMDVSEELCTATEAFFGTEYEIESIRNYKQTEFLSSRLHVTSDGSLRNNGKEFITSPLNYEESLQCFEKLHQSLHLGSDPFSHRTSTHVHLNVSNLTVEQTKHLLLLYAALEPLFFAFAGEDRKKNIHCVPLSYTLMPKYYHADLSPIIQVWSKYTAFNLLPISKQGTVEFRHLFGTGDLSTYQKLFLWYTIISFI